MTLFRQFSAVSAVATMTVSGAARAAGIPQMDHSWYANQLLWLAISFGLLFVIVSRFIAPTIHGVLGARDFAVAEAIADAERAKQTAEATRGHFESEGQAARGKASEFMAKAQAESTANAAEAIAKLDVDIARKLNQADARIQEARVTALGAMQEATAKLAQTMAEKLLGAPVSEADVAQIVKARMNG